MSTVSPTTLRPHYHILFFGVNSLDLAHALRDWELNYGYTLAKDVEYSNESIVKTSRYVSKYCSKGVFENPKVAEKNVLPAFRLISKGLGSSYVHQMKNFHLLDKRDLEEIIKRRHVVLPGNFAYKMPRYYKTKIYGQKNLLSYKMLVCLEKILDNLHVRKLEILQAENPSWSYAQAFRFLDLQTIEDSRYSYIHKTLDFSKFYSRSKL